MPYKEERLFLDRSEQGLTLIELMVALGLFSIVSLAAFSVLSSSQRAAVMNDQTVQVQQNVRLAMDLVSRDIRMAGYGNPAAGTLAGCTNHLNASLQAVGPPFVPGDNTAGADNGPDSIAVMTVDQQIGTLAAGFTTGNQMMVNGLPADIATGQVVTLEGVFTATVNAVNAVTGQLTLSQAIQGPAAFVAGTPVIRLICVTYTVSGANGLGPGGTVVNAPYQLLRNITATANNAVPIVDGIESLQLAYAVDADNDGRIDDQAGGLANTVDCLDFVPNNTACQQGGTLLAAGSVTTIPASVNATPTSVRQVRITVVGRAIPPQAANVVNNCWSDATFIGSSQIQAEDQLLQQPVFPATCGNRSGTPAGIRRRIMTRVVSLRDGYTL